MVDSEPKAVKLSTKLIFYLVHIVGFVNKNAQLFLQLITSYISSLLENIS